MDRSKYKVGDQVIFKGILNIDGRSNYIGRWPDSSPVTVSGTSVIGVERNGKFYWFSDDEVEPSSTVS